MQMANETTAITIASFSRLGIRVKDGICGGRKLEEEKKFFSKEENV